MSRRAARWREQAGGSHDEGELETALTLAAVILGGAVVGLVLAVLSTWVVTGRWLP